MTLARSHQERGDTLGARIGKKRHSKEAQMKFELPPLPYPSDALEPYLGAETLEVHYGKHHQGYMDKLERALEGTSRASLALEDLVRDSEGDVFNNAAQVWNHTFYWRSMTPNTHAPSKSLAERLDRDLGGMEAFKREFAEIASGEFGSGWAWLVEQTDGKLAVQSTHDADNPLRHGLRPLLTLDVWEHAYYLDYRNERDKYIEAFLDHLIDWSFAESYMEQLAASA
jgi:Fe-Mn family superoxide dismutase